MRFIKFLVSKFSAANELILSTPIGARGYLSVPACRPVLKFGSKRPRSLEPAGAPSSRVLRDFPTHSPRPKRIRSFMDGCSHIISRGPWVSISALWAGWPVGSSRLILFGWPVFIEGLKSKSNTKISMGLLYKQSDMVLAFANAKGVVQQTPTVRP